MIPTRPHPAALTLPVLLLAGCATGRLPDGPVTETRAPEAETLLRRAIEARGGDVYELFDDVAVRYEGRWGRIATRIQPVVADAGHRSSSEERLLLDAGVDAQHHRGPAGEKFVLRTPDASTVTFSGRATAPEDEAAAALVADAYRLFLLGAAWVDRYAVELRSLGPQELGGIAHHRVDATVRPGFGFSEEDRIRLWLHPETGRLSRLLFSLEGFETTRGAEVDVSILEWTEIDGQAWPSSFVERIRAPVRAFAHEWRLTGLDTDRGLTPDDLSVDAWTEAAARPAAPLPSR